MDVLSWVREERKRGRVRREVVDELQERGPSGSGLGIGG